MPEPAYRIMLGMRKRWSNKLFRTDGRASGCIASTDDLAFKSHCSYIAHAVQLAQIINSQIFLR
eukprot:6172267-Pleurochrysis_carterae.AAC.2